MDIYKSSVYNGPNIGIYAKVNDDFIFIPTNAFTETKSKISGNLYNNFDNEINNFVQICPKEMLDKLENPISYKKITGVAS